MLTQTQNFGCGLYAVANALDLDNFVTEERLLLSTNGINNGQLSNYMQQDGLNLYLDTLYCDHFNDKLPDSWVSINLTGDNNYMPFLIQVVINERYHLMGAKLFQDNTIDLLDSLQKEAIRCTLSDINKMYKKVMALYSFNYLEGAEYLYK